MFRNFAHRGEAVDNILKQAHNLGHSIELIVGEMEDSNTVNNTVNTQCPVSESAEENTHN